MQLLNWFCLYGGNQLKKLVVPEAFAHPAKMSVKLCRKIFEFLREKGYIHPGDTVADPFGGIGTTALVGAEMGFRVVCVELEQKFVDLAKQNFEKHTERWARQNKPLPQIIQGDSRQLSEILSRAERGCDGNESAVRRPAHGQGNHGEGVGEPETAPGCL